MKRISLVIATVVLVASACGGDETPQASSTKQPVSPSSSETPGESEVDLATVQLDPCPKGSKTQTKFNVLIKDFSFKPPTFKAPAGETVTLFLRNGGIEVHQFNSVDLGCESPLLKRYETTTVTFEMPETPVSFFCKPHWYVMKGEILPM